jgi:hypothetical protein
MFQNYMIPIIHQLPKKFIGGQNDRIKIQKLGHIDLFDPLVMPLFMYGTASAYIELSQGKTIIIQ